MKPHDQWNSNDIAQYGRMSMHVDEYADDPEPEYPDGWWIWAYLVALVFAALVVAVCMFVGRVM